MLIMERPGTDGVAGTLALHLASGILPDTLGSAVSSLRGRPQTCPAGCSGRIDRRTFFKDVDVRTSCETDVVAWASEQARLLRAGGFELLDRDHIAEEIEDVGKSDQRELASRMSYSWPICSSGDIGRNGWEPVGKRPSSRSARR